MGDADNQLTKIDDVLLLLRGYVVLKTL